MLVHFDLRDCEKYPETVTDKVQGLTAVRDRKWISTVDRGEYAFSMAVIGDTQKLVVDTPENVHYLYDWLINNKEKEKILDGLHMLKEAYEDVIFDFAQAINDGEESLCDEGTACFARELTSGFKSTLIDIGMLEESSGSYAAYDEGSMRGGSMPGVSRISRYGPSLTH